MPLEVEETASSSDNNEASRKKPIAKPNCYTVDKDWENWLGKFERVSKWSNGEKYDFLSVYLDSEADKIYYDFSKEVKQSWADLKGALTSRFGPSPQPELFEAELSARNRLPGEKLTDLGNSIRNLARKAFTQERTTDLS